MFTDTSSQTAAIKMARNGGSKKELEAALRSLPARIELPGNLSLFMDAYLKLDTEREWLTAIPWSSIRHYCQEEELDHEQTENMERYIRLMDNAILIDRQKKQRQAEQRGTNPS